MRWQWSLALASVRKQRLQSILLILGVALGCAVIIAIDLANQSARTGFALSAETLTGKATHQITAPNGVPDRWYRTLKQSFPEIVSAPVVTGYVNVEAFGGRPLRLLGIDPLAEAPFRNYLNARGGRQELQGFLPFISRTDTIMISEGLQQELSKSPDYAKHHDIKVQYGAQQNELEVVGVLKPDNSFLKQSLQGVLLADIGTAQRILNRPGQLSHIDLILPKAQQAEMLKALRDRLPTGLELRSAQAQAETMNQMTRAFSLNLSALSLLALMVGMFLIYNTISFSIVRRRKQIGILRALGVSRAEIFQQILLETFVMAIVGIGLGIGLGIVMGRGALSLVTQTINDLYFTLEVNRFSLSGWSLIKGCVGGLVAALAAAALPAWEATRTAPAGVLRSTGLEKELQDRVWPVAGGGLALGLLGVALLWVPTQSIVLSFTCFFMVVAGTALGVPLATQYLMAGVEKLPGDLFTLPARNVSRALSRTAVAIASLMVAISVVVSVSIMVGSFRQTVLDWLDNTLSADIFMTLPTRPGDTGIGLPPELLNSVRKVEGVVRAESARDVRLNTEAYGMINLIALSHDIAQKRRFVWAATPDPELWPLIAKGQVMVSQPFATRHQLSSKKGQYIQLPTDKGPQRFEVAAIYYDYASERGSVLLSDARYRQFWNDTKISSLAAFIAPGTSATPVIQRLQQLTDGQYKMVIQSNTDLRAGAIAVFDRTFAITSALRLLAIVVAFMGILSTLMALLIERTRTFGILRALGMTRRQIAVNVLIESGLMGLSAGLLALPLGTVLSLFLIYVINLRSFGWTMDFLARPAFFGQGLALAFVAALLAGLYPAIYLYRTRPADALRYESTG
jgi:putative ABC transport system permease protein